MVGDDDNTSYLLRYLCPVCLSLLSGLLACLSVSSKVQVYELLAKEIASHPAAN